MKNRMQDLDFEQTVAFDSVKDFEFTRKAAQRFRQVVSLDGFEEEDADVIFHYLYKEMELVSFGDHLKRYIYERAGLEEPFGEVTQDIYRDIVWNPFMRLPPEIHESHIHETDVSGEQLAHSGFGEKGDGFSPGIRP